MQVIIYKQDNGVFAIVHPTQEALAIKSINQIALESVPSGKKFKVIDSSQLPTDRASRASWTWPDEDLTDGTGARPI